MKTKTKTTKVKRTESIDDIAIREAAMLAEAEAATVIGKPWNIQFEIDGDVPLPPADESERIALVNLVGRVWKAHKAAGGTKANQPELITQFDQWKLGGAIMAAKKITTTGNGTRGGGGAKGERIDDATILVKLTEMSKTTSITSPGLAVKAIRSAGFSASEQRIRAAFEQMPKSKAPAKTKDLADAIVKATPEKKAEAKGKAPRDAKGKLLPRNAASKDLKRETVTPITKNKGKATTAAKRQSVKRTTKRVS